MSELKPCPFHNCLTCGCYDTLYMRDKDWNARPIEDALTAHIAELEAENDRLQDAWFLDETVCPDGSLRPTVSQLLSRIAELGAENNRLAELLHNELSSLEIATDLGNKRWIALNKIYEDGEKHNANWCKRKAQEGLGIK